MAKESKGKIVMYGGQTGKVYNSKEPVNGKLQVYFDKDGSEKRMLLSPQNVSIVGFFD